MSLGEKDSKGKQRIKFPRRLLVTKQEIDEEGRDQEKKIHFPECGALRWELDNYGKCQSICWKQFGLKKKKSYFSFKMFQMKAFTNFNLFAFRSGLHRQVQCQNVLLLTQDPDAVLQGLHAARLHGHAEHRLLPADGAHLVFLGCLLEHDQELVGDDGVEHGNDDHGEHEGDESVDLRERDVARSCRRNAQRSRLCFISHGSRGAACSGNLFLPLTLLP